MARELKDLQQLIAEKAAKRFDADYKAIVTDIQNSRLFNNMSDPKMFKVTRPISGIEEEQTAYWAFEKGYGFYEKLKDYWLPIYEAEQTAIFVEDVERLKKDVDNLYDNKNYED